MKKARGGKRGESRDDKNVLGDKNSVLGSEWMEKRRATKISSTKYLLPITYYL